MLLDFASSDKRRAALCTLWRLLRHTAQPRKGHPDHAASEALKRRILLTLLTELLHPTMTDSRGARLELLRALGVVGATDPAVLQAKPEGGAPAGGGASSVRSSDRDGAPTPPIPAAATPLPPWSDEAFLLAAAGGATAADSTVVSLGGAGAASPLYYPAVSLAALTRVLREPSLVAQHAAAVPPIVAVLSAQGAKAVPLLPAVLPLLLQVGGEGGLMVA